MNFFRVLSLESLMLSGLFVFRLLSFVNFPCQQFLAHDAGIA